MSCLAIVRCSLPGLPRLHAGNPRIDVTAYRSPLWLQRDHKEAPFAG